MDFLNADPSASLQVPKLVMKKVDIRVERKPAHLVFANLSNRLIAKVSLPPPKLYDYVDVTLGPDAKLDEIASLISLLMGNIIYHGALKP